MSNDFDVAILQSPYMALIISSIGDVLVTISTGEMSEESAAERGLVPTHAYAVIG